MSYCENFSPIKIHYSLSMWSREITWQIKSIKHQISNLTKSIASKFFRVVTYHKKLPPRNSHYPLMMCSFEVTWQIEYIIYFQKNYHYQTRQDNDLPWVTLTLKVTNVRPCDKLRKITYFTGLMFTLNLVGCWFWGGGTEHKRLICHRLLATN